MAADLPRSGSQRDDRAHFDAVLRALIVSAALHLLAFGGWKLDQRYHLLDRIRVPAWLTQAREKVFLMPAVAAVKPVQDEVPLMFVEVDPAAAVAEPVKNAKYYSDKSSRAANVEADRETGAPRINGIKTPTMKTETVEKAKPVVTPKTMPQPPQPEEIGRAHV